MLSIAKSKAINEDGAAESDGGIREVSEEQTQKAESVAGGSEISSNLGRGPEDGDGAEVKKVEVENLETIQEREDNVEDQPEEAQQQEQEDAVKPEGEEEDPDKDEDEAAAD